MRQQAEHLQHGVKRHGQQRIQAEMDAVEAPGAVRHDGVGRGVAGPGFGGAQVRIDQGQQVAQGLAVERHGAGVALELRDVGQPDVGRGMLGQRVHGQQVFIAVAGQRGLGEGKSGDRQEEDGEPISGKALEQGRSR